MTEQAIKSKMQQIKNFLMTFNIIVSKPDKNQPRASVYFNDVKLFL
jgi:hypothetical protein